MFNRNNIPLILLFVCFIAIIAIHFSNPNWAIKENSIKDAKRTLKKVYTNNFSTVKVDYWSDAANLINQHQLINEVYPYSSTLTLNLDSNAVEGRKIKVSCFGFTEAKNNELYAVVSVERKDEKFYYRPFPINIKNNEWFNYRFEDVLPEKIPEGSFLKYYILNKSEYPFLIRQLKLEIN